MSDLTLIDVGPRYIELPNQYNKCGTYHLSSHSGSVVFFTTFVSCIIAPTRTLAYASGLSWPIKERKPLFRGSPEALRIRTPKTATGSKHLISIGSIAELVIGIIILLGYTTFFEISSPKLLWIWNWKFKLRIQWNCENTQNYMLSRCEFVEILPFFSKMTNHRYQQYLLGQN